MVKAVGGGATVFGGLTSCISLSSVIIYIPAKKVWTYFRRRQQSRSFSLIASTVLTHIYEFPLTHEGMSGMGEPMNVASERSERRCGANERSEPCGQTNVASYNCPFKTNLMARFFFQ